jgi:hypothetical protein
VARVRADLSARAEHKGQFRRGVRRRHRRRLAVAFEQRLRLPLRLARRHQQQNLRQPRPRAGVHGRALFFVGDPAVRRAGRVCLPKPQVVFAGKARRKREPARTRIHRAAADDSASAGVSSTANRRSRHSSKFPPNLEFPPSSCATGFATLLAARLVTEIAGAEPAYLPARPLDAITAHHVLRAMRAGSGQDIATRDEPARAEVSANLQKLRKPNALPLRRSRC